MYKNYNWDKIEDSKRVKNWENNNHSDNIKNSIFHIFDSFCYHLVYRVQKVWTSYALFHGIFHLFNYKATNRNISMDYACNRNVRCFSPWVNRSVTRSGGKVENGGKWPRYTPLLCAINFMDDFPLYTRTCPLEIES